MFNVYTNEKLMSRSLSCIWSIQILCEPHCRGHKMVSRQPPAPTRPWTRISGAATAAATAAVLASSTLPAGAFVAPPATFPPSSTWQPTTTATTTTVTSLSNKPKAAAVDSPERGWMATRLRTTMGSDRRQARFSSGPLRAASSGSDSVPDSGEAGGEDGANGGNPPQPEMSESEKLREKLETIAKTTPATGVTQEEQDELDELEEDRRVEAEVDSLEAAEKEKVMDPFRMDDDEDDGDGADEEVYEEIIANMTKPLGITIEESTDKAQLVYLTSVGEKAEAAGLKVGDVLTGVSAVFGDAVWSVKEKNIEEIRSLVRCRTEPYSLIRVERGHVSLEERCAPGFDEEDLSNCWQLPDDMLPGEGEECELNPDYANLWAAVYEDEMEVLTGDSAARAAGVGRGGLFSNGAGGGGQPRTGNQGPPPKDKPGPGSFNGETFTGDSWDTSGASF